MSKKEGILPRQEIIDLLKNKVIDAPLLRNDQVQPCSTDMLLGSKVYCVRAGFLPTINDSIEELIKRYKHYEFEISEEKTGLLIRGENYIAELDVSLNLFKKLYGRFDPKSTTGRSDTMTRAIVEKMQKFDRALEGKRKAYIQIMPLSFNTIIKKGLALNQLRIGYGNSDLDEVELKTLYNSNHLLYNFDESNIDINDVVFHDNKIEMTVDLKNHPIVAYRAKNNSQDNYNLAGGRGAMFDLKNKFWEAIERPKDGELVLEANSFYILQTKERLSFPENICGILVPQDTSYGEGRIHYAGFFDSGFGYTSDKKMKGKTVTLEVRMHDTFVVRHGQPICLMAYQKMRDIPRDEEGNPCIYGDEKYGGNNYKNQEGPTLGKQFLPPKSL